MRGSDLAFYASSDITKILIFVIVVFAGSVSLGFWGGYLYHERNLESSEIYTKAHRSGYNAGAEAGILVFVNAYFRQGQTPFKNYAEFEKYVDETEERQKEFQARMDEVLELSREKEKTNSIWGIK